MLELRVALASGSSAPAVGLAVDDWPEIVAEDADVLEGISKRPCKCQLLTTRSFRIVFLRTTYSTTGQGCEEGGEKCDGLQICECERSIKLCTVGMKRMVYFCPPSRVENP
jgi:hypothetical protein